MSLTAFVDTETTGLDADLHQIWEVGLIVDDDEYLWQLPVDLGRADGIALRIGGFHERRLQDLRIVSDSVVVRQGLTQLHTFAEEFAALTRGRHLVGAVVSFDEERLRRLLKANGACPEWHYHLVDVEALAAGALAHSWSQDAQRERFDAPPPFALPWKSDDLSTAVGVNPEDFDRHTALGDARWAKAIYEAVFGRVVGTDRQPREDENEANK